MIAFSIRKPYIEQPSDVSNVFLDNLLLLILLKLFNRVNAQRSHKIEQIVRAYPPSIYLYLIFFLTLSIFYFLSFPISLSFFSFQEQSSSTSHFGSHSDAVKKLAISDYLIKIHILHELTFNLYGHISKVACKGQRSRLYSRITL